jgi:hypothetical protein
VDVASSSETSFTKPIIPHCARSKNISTVGIMPALKLILVSDLCVMIYLGKKKKKIHNIGRRTYLRPAVDSITRSSLVQCDESSYNHINKKEKPNINVPNKM